MRLALISSGWARDVFCATKSLRPLAGTPRGECSRADPSTSMCPSVSLLKKNYSRRAIQVQDWISVVLFAACFWIGQVQASDAPRSFLTSYGADLVGPVALYWPLRRTLFREHPNGSEVTVLVVLAGCFAWEFSQLLEWGSLPPAIAAGTFDVWDLLAYAASLVAGYALDIGMRRTA